MNRAIFVLICVQSGIATVFNACTYNEFCIDIKQCPAYEQNASDWSQNWPENVPTSIAGKHCNTEVVDGQEIISVCCPSVMNSQECGIQGCDRIFRGQEANVFDYPWMAMLQNETGAWVCGGTLVSSRYVLTAAHCGTIVLVRLGENDVNKTEDCNTLDDLKNCAPPPQDFLVEKNISYIEKFNDDKKMNDIALLKLASPVSFSYSVRTICLPDGTPEQRELNPWTYIVSGWGMNEKGIAFEKLRFAQIPAVPLDMCSGRVRNVFRKVNLDKSHVCAGGVDGVDACVGDSGGPLQYVRNDTSRYVQQGIVSFGLGLCGVIAPGVYTNVGHFITWLVRNVDE